MKLNPAFKKLWLAALKSGHYKKAKGKLKTRNGFCCLGVALDLMCPVWDAVGHNPTNFKLGTLDVEICNEIGLHITEQQNLVMLNDTKKTWKEVIQYIKKKL